MPDFLDLSISSQSPDQRLVLHSDHSSLSEADHCSTAAPVQAANKTPANKRRAPGYLVEGATLNGWKPALAELALAYPDRINPTYKTEKSVMSTVLFSPKS